MQTKASDSVVVEDENPEGRQPLPESTIEDSHAEEGGNIKAPNTGSIIPFNEEITIAKTKLEELIQRVAADSETLKERVSAVDSRQQQLDQQDSELEQKIGFVNTMSVAIKQKLEKLEKKHHHLESSTIDELREVVTSIDKIDARVIALEPTPQKLDLLAAKLESVESRLEGNIVELDRRTQGLLQRVGFLEPAVRELRVTSERLTKLTDLLMERLVFRTRMVSAALLLLLLAIVAVGMLSHSQISQVETASKQQQQEIASTQDEITDIMVQLGKTGSVVTENNETLKQRYESLAEKLQVVEGSLAPQADAAANTISIVVHNEDWVLQQDPSHFSIQLYGTDNKSELFNFIRHFQGELTAPVSYIETQYRGRDWFVLLYGDYKSFEESAAAIERLPQEVLRFRPWVRSNNWLHQNV